LRQLAIILRTYTNEHDHLFPDARYIYHSAASFDRKNWRDYPKCCRWHDERMGFDSILLRDRPELRGSLWPYLGNKEILRCQVGQRANNLRGCCNACAECPHNPLIPVVCQYTYTMNAYLGASVYTGRTGTGSADLGLDKRTIRETHIRRASQVTRSPASVFVFGEENSWAVNIAGKQPRYASPLWPADYDLSGHVPGGFTGILRLPDLEVFPTHARQRTHLSDNDGCIGDAFATYHRPKGGDLNTGYSFAALLDGHVEKVTVADQLRKSRRIPGLAESRLGPGGNLTLAWLLDIPPLGGWNNQ